MAWTKLGDEFPDEAGDLSDAAVRTHVEGLCWSNRRLLEGRIPKRDLRRFAFCADESAAVAELVHVGWWTDQGDGWQIVHDLGQQLTAEQVMEEREASKVRIHKWRNDKRRQRAHVDGKHHLCSPGNCAALRDVQVDTQVDTEVDNTPDMSADSGVGAGQGQGRALEDPAPTKALRVARRPS